MSGSIAPQWLFQIFDDNGNIASGAKLYSYVSGTTEPTPVYSDYACTTPLANPYTANAAGRVNFWLKDGIGYRLKVETATGEVLCDRWPIYGASSGAPNEVDPVLFTEMESFPLGEMNWLQDTGGDLWENDLCFVCEFLVSGFTKLRHIRSLFAANSGSPSGKFAVYASSSITSSGEILLYQGSLFDNTSSGTYTFDPPLDITGMAILSVYMDPGVSPAQPVKQSIEVIPPSTELGHTSFSGMAIHEHNTTFAAPAPAMLTDLKFMLARWMKIGVSND